MHGINRIIIVLPVALGLKPQARGKPCRCAAAARKKAHFIKKKTQ
jgi:hypothetical protein